MSPIVTRFLPGGLTDAYLGLRHARSTFKRWSRGSRVFFPRKIPLFIKLYFLYVTHLLHEATESVSGASRIYLGLPKHLKNLPLTRQTVVIQIEQAIFTGTSDHLSRHGLSELRLDPATQDVVGGVRLHGDLEIFKHASAVVDYSALNIERLTELPELKTDSEKFHNIAPLLGTYPENIKPREEVTVATIYGSPDRGRRGRMGAMLSEAGIQVRNIRNFENYDIAFQDVGILLNFRQVEHFSTPEELRILPALLQGVIVITEDTPFARQSLCADFLFFAGEQDLARKIREVQNNYSRYWNQIFGGHRFADFVRNLETSNLTAAARIVRTIDSTRIWNREN